VDYKVTALVKSSAVRKESKVQVNLNIEQVDVAFIKKVLKDHPKPVTVDYLVNEVALFKTKAQRKTRVKIYSPDCEYKVGDLIFKEYTGKIPVGAKKYVDIEDGIVLKVIDVRVRYGSEEIVLSYEGTSVFKKYTDYLERQKIELLLPHKQAKPPAKTELLAEEADPRQQLDPMMKRELSQLGKKMIAAINKDDAIVIVAGKILLKEFLKPIEPDVFERIRLFLQDSKASEATEFLVENFIKIKPKSDDFETYCFSLSHKMQTDYKIDFHQTQSDGWGKWNLISVIYRLKRDSLVSVPNPLVNKVRYAQKKNLALQRKKMDDSIFTEGSKRFYLTQREVAAGAFKVHSGQFDFGESVEVEALDSDTKKSYRLFYYSDTSLLIGFKEVFDSYSAIQGMCLQIEQVAANQIHFSIRTTKKGMVVKRIKYDAEKMLFLVSDEQMATPVFVNKAIYLEEEVINSIAENILTYRGIETFNQLFHKIFLDFGIKDRNYEIHLLRLYHILDLIYPTDWKLVLDIVLSNPEFIPSDKVAGVFYLDSDAVMAIEEEERQRRQLLVEERRRSREEVNRKKQEEEDKEQEEIRQLREERRRKREEEMWLKEKIQQDGETPIEQAAQEPVKTVVEAEIPKMSLVNAEESEDKKSIKKKKRQSEEKGPKTGGRRHSEEPMVEDIDLDEVELKRQIELEELKAKAIERAREVMGKPSSDEKEVVYQDATGSFAGLFASKLEEISKDKKKGKKETK